MLGRKKGFTAAQSKHTSRRMQSATIGTHVARRARPSREDMNAASVGFSSPRKKKRAARGVVDHVMPSAASQSGASVYAGRVSQRQFAQEIQRKARVRRIVVIVVSLVVVACVAIGVGVATFVGSLNDRLSLGDSNAASALVAQAEGKPYYLLCSAHLGTYQGNDGPQTDAYLLVRIDEGTRDVTAVALPANTRVKLSDGETHPLYDAAGLGGDAALVKAVATFAGVDISHFAKTDAEGIAALVNAVGGVTVDLVEEVDDPTAGDVYLAAGSHELDAAAALTLLRAGNYEDGVASQAANRTAFVQALVERLLEARGLGFVTQLDATAACVQTDWDALQVVDLARALRPLDASTVKSSVVPGYELTTGGSSVYVADTDEWTSMMARVEAGDDPAASDDAPAPVVPGSFTIIVRNGASITGGARQLADILAAKGFNVTETGNTDDYVTYPETFVIYHDEAFAPAAAAVAEAIGAGRSFNGGTYYTFESDVLVIIGKDWQPIV